MAKVKIEEKLDQLAELRTVIKDFTNEITKLVKCALSRCSDLKERYDEVQFAIGAITERENTLSEEIKEVVIKSGESAKGQYLQAVYSKGKTTWDTKALEGYAVAHPEVNQLKKVGEPLVSIRDIKEVKKE